MSKKPDGQFDHVELDDIIEIEKPQIAEELIKGLPFTEELEVIVDQTALEAMEEHGKSDVDVEVGGVLLGEIYQGKSNKFVEITGSIQAKNVNSGLAHLEFTNKTWEGIELVREKEHPGKKIVGWYHTHPGIGLFMSSADEFIHKNFFQLPWHIALVLDPVNDNYKFFRWKETEIEAFPSFSLKLKSAPRPKSSVIEQVEQAFTKLEKSLNLEPDFKNLKTAVKSLKGDLLRIKNDTGYSDRHRLLEIMMIISKFEPEVKKEGDAFLNRRKRETRLNDSNTKVVFSSTTRIAQKPVICSSVLYSLDSNAQLHIVDLNSQTKLFVKKNEFRGVYQSHDGTVYTYNDHNELLVFSNGNKDGKKKGKMSAVKIELSEADGYKLEDFRFFSVSENKLFISTSERVWILKKDSETQSYRFLRNFPDPSLKTELVFAFGQLDVDKDGNCYVADVNNDVVLKLNSEGDLKNCFISEDNVSLGKLKGLCVCGSSLFVLDTKNQKIVQLRLHDLNVSKVYDIDFLSLESKITEIIADTTGELYLLAGDDIMKVLKTG